MPLNRRQGFAAPLLLGLHQPPALAQQRLLRFARQGDWQIDFAYQLLSAALDASGEAGWQLQPSPERLSHARAMVEIEGNRGEVDVLWTMTSRERERQLLPVRIPIFRGLFGWRVLFVRRGEAARFAGVRSLADLRAFSFLQGHDWPDASILEANGLPVVRATRFESLFPMLARGRADAFPRSVLEVASELSRFGGQHALALEPLLALHYPTAVYYFVSPKRPELAALIERGLRRLLANGWFERQLLRFHADALALVRLAQRRVIQLHNPLLPEATPLAEARLWHRP